MTDTLQNILQAYALINLALIPVSVFFAIVAYRNTDILFRLDAVIDRFLDRKDARNGKAAPADGTVTDKKPGPAPAAAEAATEEDELQGVASFRILVGDIYHCQLSSKHSDERIYQLKWTCDNDFVGDIDENAVFTGRKAGKVKVMCSRKDDAFDTGSTVYQIEVVPTDENWFASKMVADVVKRAPKDAVLAAMASSRIIEEKPGRRLIAYEGSRESRKTVVQFDQGGRLLRAAYILKPAEAGTIENIRRQLKERFDTVELDGGDIEIWMHRNSDEEKNEVDVYAFLKKLRSGGWALCVGQSWREYGEIEEFILNISMAEKMFSDCLPGEPFSDVKAKPLDAEKKPAHTDGRAAAGSAASDAEGKKEDGPAASAAGKGTAKEETATEETGGDEGNDEETPADGDGEQEPGTVDFEEEGSFDNFDDYSE